jgi:hypothetical protein
MSCLIGAAQLINKPGAFSVRILSDRFSGFHVFRYKHLNLFTCSAFPFVEIGRRRRGSQKRIPAVEACAREVRNLYTSGTRPPGVAAATLVAKRTLMPLTSASDI